MYNKQLVNELNNLEYSGKPNLLGVDYYYDERKLYEYYKHEPRLYFRNGYNSEYDFIYIPITETVDFNFIRQQATNLSPYTILKLCEFVEENHKKLLECANEQLDFETIRDGNNKKIIKESQDETVDEMAILRPNFTGLENSIWIDNGGDVQKSRHSGSDRIKYCAYDSNPNNSDTWYPVRISDGAFLYKPKKDWSTKGKKNLQRYIETNKERLIQARNEHWSDKDLKTKLAYIGKYSQEPVEPPIRKEYYPYKTLEYGFIEVQEKKNNKFNLEKNGKIISPIWFDFITPFNEFQGQYCLGCSQGIYYNIYPNGTVKMSEISKLHGFKSKI